MTYRWIDLGDGRSVYRKMPEPDTARSSLAAPMVMKDAFDRPVQCMADGMLYESKRAMAATHKRMGYVELGDHRGPAFSAPAPDPVSRKSVLKATLDKAGIDPHRIVER